MELLYNKIYQNLFCSFVTMPGVEMCYPGQYVVILYDFGLKSFSVTSTSSRSIQCSLLDIFHHARLKYIMYSLY